MSNAGRSGRWRARFALAALLAGTSLLAGCYYPYHPGRHGGWYGYDHHDGGRHDGRRDRRHDRRHGDRDGHRGGRR